MKTHALKMLMEDHRRVEALFKAFERAGDAAKKEKARLAGLMVRELSVHSVVEEQILYPAARAHEEELEETVLEALEEHHVVKWLLLEIDKLSAESERFDAKVKVLTDMVRHHVEEEERELFPMIRDVMGSDELEALGAAMEQVKAMAPTHPHPRAPDEPPGNVLAGMFAKIIDTGRDAVAGVKRRPAPSARVARAKRR